MTKTNYGVPYMRMNDWNLSQREDCGGIVGQEFIYRDDLPVATRAQWAPGVIVAPGMRVRVVYTFRNWNFVDGLTLHYVHVPATGMYTHVSDSDLSGRDTCDLFEEAGSCYHGEHMALR